MRVFVAGASGNVGRTIIRSMSEYDGFELVGGWCRQAGSDLGVLAGITPIGIAATDNLAEGLRASSPDIVIDFSAAPALESNMQEYLAQSLNVVIGTTGLTDAQYEPYAEAVAKHGLRWAAIANYGLGISFAEDFIRTVKEHYPYVSIIDRHHENMANAPSGTAAGLAKAAEGKKGGIASRESYPGVLAGNICGTQVIAQRMPWPGPYSEHEIMLGRKDEIIKITVTDYTSDIYMDGVFLTAGTLPLMPPGTFARSLSEVRKYS